MLWSEQHCGFDITRGEESKNEEKLEKLKRKERK